MYNIYQHWDPLRVCIVGRSYPPEFYNWVTHSKTRNLLEQIAQETEEDYQKIINKLESFGVQILRPNCEQKITDFNAIKTIPPPPMMPRDNFVMIGKTLYRPQNTWDIFYQNIKDDSWPQHASSLKDLNPDQQQECEVMHGWGKDPFVSHYPYQDILQGVEDIGVNVQLSPSKNLIGSMVSRIGKDLYFATQRYDEDQGLLKRTLDKIFTDTRNHVVNTGGHGDGTYCPVCPGLIISLRDVPTYAETFPGWEVVYLPGQSWAAIAGWAELKKKNHGKWWLPGKKTDDHFIGYVDTWMKDWVGYVEETVFDVNILIIDPKNVIVFNENDKVFAALARYGITPHVVNFRHRYFWDGGIHCVTLDLHRDGTMQDFFPDRACLTG